MDKPININGVELSSRQLDALKKCFEVDGPGCSLGGVVCMLNKVKDLSIDVMMALMEYSDESFDRRIKMMLSDIMYVQNYLRDLLPDEEFNQLQKLDRHERTR